MTDPQAKIVGLDGLPVSGLELDETPLSVLKSLVVQIEAGGGLFLESVFVIATRPNPENPTFVSHPTWDSGVRAAEAVFMLEIAKANLLEALRR